MEWFRHFHHQVFLIWSWTLVKIMLKIDCFKVFRFHFVWYIVWLGPLKIDLHRNLGWKLYLLCLKVDLKMLV